MLNEEIPTECHKCHGPLIEKEHGYYCPVCRQTRKYKKKKYKRDVPKGWRCKK